MSDVSLSKKQVARIKRLVTGLNNVRKEIQLENPDHCINWYLEDCGNLNLLKGESHSGGYGAEALYENVLLTVDLEESAGGGW